MKRPIRLQRYLAQCGAASRRGAEQLIADGRVSVNGKRCTTLGTSVVPDADVVTVDGKTVAAFERVLYAFHKPRGLITTLRDEAGRFDLSAVQEELGIRLNPIGRLDSDVGGLLLLTNDGDYAHQLTHPSFAVSRTYVARLNGQPDEDSADRLLRGCRLRDGVGRADSVEFFGPEQARVAYSYWRRTAKSHFVRISVHEGRNHFVKRLLAAVGLPVEELYRVAFGPYRLGKLRPGELKQFRFEKLSPRPASTSGATKTRQSHRNTNAKKRRSSRS